MHRGSPGGHRRCRGGRRCRGRRGRIVGHFWHTISKEKVREVSDLLHSGESGLLIIAVNHKSTDIARLLENAEKKVVIETKAGDLDAAFEDGLKKAQAAQAAAKQ